MVKPPDHLAQLEEWRSYRAGLDALEARLLVTHPDLDWLDGFRAFKAEADAGIARHMPMSLTSANCSMPGKGIH